MKLKKGLILGVTVLCLSACSTQGFTRKKSVLERVQPGMTREQVSEELGKPDYRRFDAQSEEWEYRRRKCLAGKDVVMLVTFEQGRVVAFDSFECPDQPVAPVIPPVSSPGHYPYPDRYPSVSAADRLPVMTQVEFDRFVAQVKAEPFSDNRKERIRVLATSRRLTCRQCATLLRFFSFSDDKMETLRRFAPYLVDRENYPLIQQEFSSHFDREDVKKVLGI